MSTSPKSAFGDRAALFELDLTESLLRSNPSGVFKEQLETQVVIARKQGMGRRLPASSSTCQERLPVGLDENALTPIVSSVHSG